MTRTWAEKLVAIALLFAFPMSMIAADARGAMVYATNGVSINGAAVPRTGTILAGDKVEVPADSAVAINAPGTQIVLAAGSNATYAPQSITLGEKSGVEVRTEKGVSVNVDKLVIKPAANGAAKFRVARGGGEVLIAVKSGMVDIADGNSTTTVAEGEAKTVPDPAPQQPGATPGATAGGVGMSTALAVAVAAAVIAVAALVSIETSKAPSASRP